MNKTDNYHLGLWAMAVIVMLVLPWFFVAIDLGPNIVAWGKTMDTFHFIFFALLAVWLQKTLQHQQIKRATLIAGLLCIAIMSLIEVIQPMYGRSASLADLSAGSAGTVVALLAIAYWHNRISLLHKASLLSLFVITFVLVSAEATAEWYAVYWRQQQIPQLGRFESATEMRLWHANNETLKVVRTNDYATENKHSLLVKTHANTWGGARYQAGDMDWSAYDKLAMTIYNPSDEFLLKVRIDDSRPSPDYGDRIDTSVNVKPGWNNIAINLHDAVSSVKSNDFDFTSIRKLILFTSKEAPSLDFYLDDVRLN